MFVLFGLQCTGDEVTTQPPRARLWTNQRAPMLNSRTRRMRRKLNHVIRRAAVDAMLCCGRKKVNRTTLRVN